MIKYFLQIAVQRYCFFASLPNNFRTFVDKYRLLMRNKLSPTMALYCVYLGVFILVLSRVTGWNRMNGLLLTALLLIFLGIIGYILIQKHQDKY